VGYFVLAVAVVGALVYYFVVRPIQKDKALDSCLKSMWSLYGNQEDVYNTKIQTCYKEFK